MALKEGIRQKLIARKARLATNPAEMPEEQSPESALVEALEAPNETDADTLEPEIHSVGGLTELAKSAIALKKARRIFKQ